MTARHLLGLPGDNSAGTWEEFPCRNQTQGTLQVPQQEVDGKTPEHIAGEDGKIPTSCEGYLVGRAHTPYQVSPEIHPEHAEYVEGGNRGGHATGLQPVRTCV